MLPAVTARASALHFITCIVIAPLVLKILAAFLLIGRRFFLVVSALTYSTATMLAIVVSRSLGFLHSAVANREELCRVFIAWALLSLITYISEALCGWVFIG